MRFSIDCFPSTRKYIATPTVEPPTGEKASDISVLFRALVSMVVPSSCVTVVLIARRCADAPVALGAEVVPKGYAEGGVYFWALPALPSWGCACALEGKATRGVRRSVCCVAFS